MTLYYKGYYHDLQKRVQQHNAGMTVSIRPYIPFGIVYFEAVETEKKRLPAKNISNLQQGDVLLKTN